MRCPHEPHEHQHHNDSSEDHVEGAQKPNNRNHHGSHHQVVGLVIEQIAHYTVVPFGNVPEVRPGETIRAREEIVPGTERGEVHVHVPLLRELRLRNLEAAAATTSWMKDDSGSFGLVPSFILSFF